MKSYCALHFRLWFTDPMLTVLDLGHQCALERDYGKCSYPETCHLRVTHGMDKTKFVRYDKDDNPEYA